LFVRVGKKRTTGKEDTNKGCFGGSVRPNQTEKGQEKVEGKGAAQG